jgi:hypothetical protein
VCQTGNLLFFLNISHSLIFVFDAFRSFGCPNVCRFQIFHLFLSTRVRCFPKNRSFPLRMMLRVQYSLSKKKRHSGLTCVQLAYYIISFGASGFSSFGRMTAAWWQHYEAWAIKMAYSVQQHMFLVKDVTRRLHDLTWTPGAIWVQAKSKQVYCKQIR